MQTRRPAALELAPAPDELQQRAADVDGLFHP
jgi:hypothetical protein